VSANMNSTFRAWAGQPRSASPRMFTANFFHGDAGHVSVALWHGGQRHLSRPNLRARSLHTNDAWLDFVGGGHTHKNGAGGWHDAGDYNKYTVNAGLTVGTLFRAGKFRPRKSARSGCKFRNREASCRIFWRK